MKRIEILIEAEQFEDYGGWILESQFVDEMGSAYLLAHGIGTPVADAMTTVDIPEAGEYRVWVRTKDWVPDAHPGTFQVLIGGRSNPQNLWSQRKRMVLGARGTCPVSGGKS